MPPRKSKSVLVMPPPPPPQHPFDQIHGVETSGLIAAGNLTTGHPNDAHVTAYYGVAPSILRTLIDLWRATTTLSSTSARAKAAPCSSPASSPSTKS
jgi:hypothetical protein